MKTTSNTLRMFRHAAASGLLVLFCIQSFSVAAQDRSEKLRRYDADRKACLSGKTDQTIDSCLKEAKAVLTERPGANPYVSPEQMQRNALIRCEALTGEERSACVARMQGAGTVSGSVAGGGVLRELVTTEVVTSPAPRPESTGAR